MTDEVMNDDSARLLARILHREELDVRCEQVLLLKYGIR